MDPRSEAILAHVHPDLAKVVRYADISAVQPFEVTYGLRTLEAEAEAVRTGHSQTMHSRHLPNKDGLSCAVDLTPLILGKLSFAPGREAPVYGAISVQMHRAAARLLVPIEWGGDWHSWKDWGHFQLPWKDYP